MPASLRGLFGWALLALALAAPTHAQFNDILGGKGLTPDADAVASPASLAFVSAHFTAPQNGQPGMLNVTARIEAPWYTYSTTQPPVAATPTQIHLDAPPGVRLAGPFRSTLPPALVHDEALRLTFEEFSDSVTWQAPLEFQHGTVLEDLQIAGSVKMQLCKTGSCLAPTEFPFTATFLKIEPVAASQGSYRHPAIHAELQGHLEPRVAAPGTTARLVLTATMPQGWHVYALAGRESGEIGTKPTLIAFENTSGFALQPTVSSVAPREAPPAIPGQPPQSFYEGTVTWTTPIAIPPDARPGPYPIAGVIGYQTCFEDARCDQPRGARFAATLTVGAKSEAGAVPLAFSDARYGEAAQLAAAHPTPVAGEGQNAQAGAPLGWTLPVVILAGLVGGFILNFMPCVLPVIGLKILAFAEQAGRSRGQILALNLWYALGTLAVFMVLATLATSVSWGLGTKNLGWGEQFSYTSFNIVLVGIVFAMALSFLGVWEIPIPGFVGSGRANELAAREGAIGAFCKGMLATVLATPCSGPALGPVFGFTLNQPPSITYLLFACIALGMSAPYLLIGAFPTLIRFLPKPGAWMDTFKQLMGFVLLGTIVFLFTFMDRDYLVPTFAMMVGLWIACWWIGRTPLTEGLGRKLTAWALGAAAAGVVSLAAFTWLVPQAPFIPWQPFSPAELARLRESGSTVLVDFTAEWCLTCKANLKFAIETNEVREALAANNVVPMLADWTKGSPEIKDALASLNSNSIPLLAIFPADRPDQPIVLRDLITKQQVLEAIEQAGPSRREAKLTAAMP